MQERSVVSMYAVKGLAKDPACARRASSSSFGGIVARGAALFLAAALLFLCASCGRIRGSALASYAVGRTGEAQTGALSEEDETVTLPPVFVRAWALLCARPSYEVCLRLLYDHDAVYMKALLEECARTPEELLSAMNDRAAASGEALSFGSLTGSASGEEALSRLLGRDELPFAESVGSVKALKKAAEAWASDGTLCDLLQKSAVTAADGKIYVRAAPMVNVRDQYYLPAAVFYLGGFTDHNGQNAYVAVAAIRENGETAYGAVCEVDGESPVYYASTDLCNLIGETLGKDYKLVYSPPADQTGTGMVMGATFFSGAVLAIFIAVGVTLVLAVIGGIILKIKRNREGRKKYAPPKEEENRPGGDGASPENGS